MAWASGSQAAVLSTRCVLEGAFEKGGGVFTVCVWGGGCYLCEGLVPWHLCCAVVDWHGSTAALQVVSALGAWPRREQVV
jgi:hypothetical protein